LLAVLNKGLYDSLTKKCLSIIKLLFSITITLSWLGEVWSIGPRIVIRGLPIIEIHGFIDHAGPVNLHASGRD